MYYNHLHSVDVLLGVYVRMCMCMCVWVGGRVSALVGLPFLLLLLLSSVAYMCASTYSEGATTTTSITHQELSGVSVTTAA
jgi:hypothetical protein